MSSWRARSVRMCVRAHACMCQVRSHEDRVCCDAGRLFVREPERRVVVFLIRERHGAERRGGEAGGGEWEREATVSAQRASLFVMENHQIFFSTNRNPSSDQKREVGQEEGSVSGKKGHPRTSEGGKHAGLPIPLSTDRERKPTDNLKEAHTQ